MHLYGVVVLLIDFGLSFVFFWLFVGKVVFVDMGCVHGKGKGE
jgi:hypothetical protein